MTPPPLPSSEVWIFVDDSNIWIEAKKLGSKLKHFKTGEDHRIRIDMGKLADVLARGRTIRQGTLYGSEPPPVDTVWSKIRSKGWKVVTRQRSITYGKEIQLHTKFVSDIVSTAWSTPTEDKSTIILVTGDADIIPAIDQVLEAGGWNVEVYMWEHATSNRLKRLATNDHVTVHYLDSSLGEVMYTNMVFGYNKNFGQMIKTCGIILTIAADSNSFPGHVPTNQWISQVEELAQWPVQYYWFNHPETGRSNNLLMVFKDDIKAGKFDIEKFLKKITSDTNCPIPSVVGAQSCMDFIASNHVDRLGGDFEQLGLFSSNDVYEGYQNTSAVYASSYLPLNSGSTSVAVSTVVKCFKWKSRFYSPSHQI